jgi:hypothetical protein
MNRETDAINSDAGQTLRHFGCPWGRRARASTAAIVRCLLDSLLRLITSEFKGAGCRKQDYEVLIVVGLPATH